MIGNYVYIASRYSRKEEMQDVASILVDRGLVCKSSWLDEPHGPNTSLEELTPEQHLQYAKQDFEDIMSSDAMLFFAEDPNKQPPRGGRHVEFGYAFALGVDIYIIGPKENIFHYLPNIKHFETFEEFLEKECRP